MVLRNVLHGLILGVCYEVLWIDPYTGERHGFLNDFFSEESNMPTDDYNHLTNFSVLADQLLQERS